MVCDVMRIYLPVLAPLFMAVAAVGQVVNQYDVLQASPEDINLRLTKSVEGPDGPLARKLIFDEVLASRRLELIKVCFANAHTVYDTVQAIADMPDGEFKQRATIMLLRTPSALFWPSENHLEFSSIVRPSVMREPFISVIPQLLPHVELSENWLKYQIGRAKLADDMEAALNAKGAKMPARGKSVDAVSSAGSALAAQNSPSLREASTRLNPPATTVQVPTPAYESRGASPSGAAITPEVERQPRQYLWITGGVLALLVLAWQAMKKRG